MMKKVVLDQVACFEYTTLNFIFMRRRLSGEKTVWKAERAWLLDRRKER